MSDITDDDVDAQENEKADKLELLRDLKEKHRHIDVEIKALEETGAVDVLKVRRMKKIKLSIKDRIRFLENQLTPDIIA